MASTGTGQRRWTLAVCAVLVGIAVVAVAFQGVPAFTGPRVFLPPGPVVTDRPEQNLTGTPEPQRPQQQLRIDLSWLLVALIVLAVIVALAILWRYRRRSRPAPELPSLAGLAETELSAPAPEPTAEPEPEHVRRGLDRASAELAAPREPRDAIERAWLGLEEGAADSGVQRLPAETPAEFASRVVARVAADRDAAQRFLGLYVRARFSTAPVTDSDVAAARDAVAALRASWSTTSSSTTAGKRR
ncbi:DUF4129 domain-containing protein [Leifsonia sp. 22587]|uniref:DUF4129 domain-containing protein n=1 Tax=Leifsonia sp. 22587 TaxID=3453946 RepID=UPI003F862C21